MTLNSISEIKNAVSELSPQELDEFREWFEEFEAAIWDIEFENDVKTGKLDAIAKKALEDYRNGNCREL